MASSGEFVNYVMELLAPAGRVASKRMFGGHGIYLDGLFMAIIVDDELYLKADEATKAAFDAESCAPFFYSKDGKSMTMGYRRAPGDAMDAPHMMLPWARLALQAAVRAQAAKEARVKKITRITRATPKKKPAAKKSSSRPAGKKRPL
jgi:DNA transformation protein